MEKIIQINYQNRSLRIEESAYEKFQNYEQTLKVHFEQQESGDEIFSDLQYRMAEILEQKCRDEKSIRQEDIEELISTIGSPSDLGAEPNHESGTGDRSRQKRKLFRNKTKGERIIAGVCSGIAYYFNMDPLAIRLAFVLLTVFNIATLFSFNLGILVYIIFWIVLPSAELRTNLRQKLFRNPKDKVIAGVCSGIAQFFNLETWIVRLIFLAPFLLGILANANHGNFGIHHISSFFYSVSFSTYLLLWILVPLAKSSTDYMLLKGEPINLNTIHQAGSISEQAGSGTQGGLNTFLKVLAYIIIGLFLLFLIPFCISMIAAFLFSWSLADIVLYSSWNKWLAIFALLFFAILPLIGIIIWFIRRLAGYSKPNRVLRLGFISLHVLGWVSLVWLVISLVHDHSTFVRRPEKWSIPFHGDTLHLRSVTTNELDSHKVVFSFHRLDHLIRRRGDELEVKAVWLRYRQSPDSLFSIEVDRSAFGAGQKLAGANADQIAYTIQQQNNQLYIPAWLSVPSRQPYHFQNVRITIYIPAGKKVMLDKKLQQQLDYKMNFDENGFYFDQNHHDDDEPEDQIIEFQQGDLKEYTLSSNGDTLRVELDSGSMEQAKQILDDVKRQAKERKEEFKRQRDERNREEDLKWEEMEREMNTQIEEARQKVEEAKQRK